MAKILLVEDDPILGKGLVLGLELAGYAVNWETTLKGAHHRNDNFEYDLIILDLNLPDGSGIDFCRHVRSTNSIIPVIVLTARIDEDSVIDGLECGASDYVKKPFSQRELIARVKTALRENQTREDQLRIGPIHILKEQRRILVDGKDLELNRREFDLFSLLANRMGTVISRENMITSLNLSLEMSDRTLDSHMSHIRTKLKKSGFSNININSVYGVGYRLDVM